MGLRQSGFKVPPASPSVPIFALTFRKPDTITLVLADNNVNTLVTRVCKEMWTRGFEYTGRHADESYVIIFKGNPFLSTATKRRTDESSSETIKRICSRLLSELFAMGYECVLASDLSRANDFTTWFFEQRAAPDHAPAPIIVCLSLSAPDRLQLFNGNELLKRTLRDTVIESYGPGIADEETYEEYTDDEYYELRLCGSPWDTTSFDLSIWVRKMILAVFSSFNSRNYRFYTNACLRGNSDSIFFIYEHDITTTADVRRKSIYGPADTDFCLISLNGNNRLRLLMCTNEVIDATRKTIVEKWPYGCTRQLDIADGIVREFEMGGQPWWAANGDAVASRAFLAQLFETLLEMGWRIVCSLDISRKNTNKSIFILQSRGKVSRRHFCISFNDADKIRIIRARPDVAIMVEKSVIGNWPRGIKRESDYYSSREIKLKGTPFEPDRPNEACMVRVLLCFLLNRMHKIGCRVVASSDVSAKFHRRGKSGQHIPIDVHSWFVTRRD